MYQKSGNRALSNTTIVLSCAFALIVVARWLHPALYDVGVTYWLAGLATLAALTASMMVSNHHDKD